MRVFVVTKGERTSTVENLMKANIPFVVVTHSTKTLKNLTSRVELRNCDTLVTNKKGILSSRNAVLAETRNDDWFVCMDDDMLGVYSCDDKLLERTSIYKWHEEPPKKYQTWRRAFAVQRSYRELINVFVPQLHRKIDEFGGVCGAFNYMENPMLRGNHRYSKTGGLATGCHTMRGGVLKQLKGGNVAHDQWLRIWSIANYGCSPVDNFVHVKTKIFTPGGIGTLDERSAELTEQLSRIDKEFPGLVTVKFPGTRIKLRNRKLDEWRREQGYLKEHT